MLTFSAGLYLFSLQTFLCLYRLGSCHSIIHLLSVPNKCRIILLFVFNFTTAENRCSISCLVMVDNCRNSVKMFKCSVWYLFSLGAGRHMQESAHGWFKGSVLPASTHLCAESQVDNDGRAVWRHQQADSRVEGWSHGSHRQTLCAGNSTILSRFVCNINIITAIMHTCIACLQFKVS